MTPTLQAKLGRAQAGLLLVGLVALALTVYGAWSEPRQFFFSYLFGYLFWLGLSLGCFMVTMIHQLTGGRWGYPTRRIFEAGFLVLPLMLILFIPIFFGLSDLYPWARAADRAVEPVLAERHVYQNGWAYIARTVCFLLIWTWMAHCLRKWSLEQDATADAAPTRKARALSGPGLVRVPITRAMDLLLERGLPVRRGTNQTATGPSSFELQQQRPLRRQQEGPVKP